MEIKTKPYGIVTINPDDVIHFDYGLIGFEEHKRYVLLGDPSSEETLVWLQALDEGDFALPVVQPKFFRPDYKPVVHEGELEELELKDSSDALIFSVVVIPEDVRKMTANLRAPLIINVKNNKGKQIILNDDNYKIKEYILGTNKGD